MSINKKTVQKYIQGFRTNDHDAILSCLTDSIIWEIPGYYRHTGKEAFDKEIENDLFVGNPDITIYRMVEEDGVVVAEGKVQHKKKDGGMLDAVFCDVFHMEDGKIKQLTSYLMNK